MTSTTTTTRFFSIGVANDGTIPIDNTLITFTAENPAEVEIVGQSRVFEQFRGVDFDESGNLFGIARPSGSDSYSFYILSTTTGLAIEIGGGKLTVPGRQEQFLATDLAWDPVNGRMLLLASGSRSSTEPTNPAIFEIDLATGRAILVGIITGISGNFGSSLAIDEDGNLYIHGSRQGKYYQVSPDLDTVTQLTGFQSGVFLPTEQGSTIDWSGNGTLYQSASLPTNVPEVWNETLFSIDRQTGVATAIGRIGTNFEPDGVQAYDLAIQTIVNDDDDIFEGEIVDAGAGDDIVYATGNNNFLIGGIGNDTLFGGTGRNTLYGEAGSDVIYGGEDGNFIDGGSGNDLIYGSESIDGIFGGAGLDTIYLGIGDDSVNAEAGSDQIFCGQGNDFVIGGEGRDFVSGGQGRDRLFGDEGADTLLGGNGADYLAGGPGFDTLTGGLGADSFSTEGQIMGRVATITDFTTGVDKILLNRITFLDLTNLPDGALPNHLFSSVTSDTAAASSTALIVYNSARGALFYNKNGTAAGFGDGGQFMNLLGNPTLKISDLVIQGG